MANRPTTTQMLRAACVVLGMGLLVAPAKAQAPASAVEADRSTAQPPGSSDLDTNFWSLVRDSNDPAALQSYLQSFPPASSPTSPASASRRCARTRPPGHPRHPQRIPRQGGDGEGTPPSSPAPELTPSATGNADLLPRTLQRELKRVGCLAGDPDGVWGEQSRTALKNFSRHAKVNIPGDEPSNAALDATLAKPSRVCPIVCDSDEKLVGERCVAVPKPPRPAVKEQPTRREQPRRAWAERPAAEPSESGAEATPTRARGSASAPVPTSS